MSAYHDATGGWLRVWRHGPGVSWTKEPPLFAERMGIDRPFLKVRGWRLFWLASTVSAKTPL